MRWPWQKTEKRSRLPDEESDEVLRRFFAHYGAADAKELAAVQFAAGLMERAFQSVEIRTGDSRFAVPARTLSMAARALAIRGETTFLISVRDGRAVLYPASSFEIYGESYDPDLWRYRLHLQGPTGHTSERRPARGVVHFRVNVDPRRPWKGEAMLQLAKATADTATDAENFIGEELQIKSIRLITSQTTDAEQEKQLQEKIEGDGGNIIPLSVPLTGEFPQYRPAVIQPELSDPHLRARADAAADLLLAMGIPIELIRPAGVSANAGQAAWRRFLVSMVQPWAAMMRDELRVKLNRPDLEIGLAELSAGDVFTRSRAAAALAGIKGVKKDEALKLAGFS